MVKEMIASEGRYFLFDIRVLSYSQVETLPLFASPCPVPSALGTVRRPLTHKSEGDHGSGSE